MPIPECAEPVAPEYGSITYSGRHIGATAEQSCDEGYKLSGKAVITCLEDGLWSEPPVTCTKIGNVKHWNILSIIITGILFVITRAHTFVGLEIEFHLDRL